MAAKKKTVAAEARTADIRCRVTWPHGVNLRAGPGVGFPALRVLPFGTVVTQEGDPERVEGAVWLPVRDGWVCSLYLERLPDSPEV